MKSPARERQPRVDDHFVREGARVEVVKGILVMASAAETPHATMHFSLTYVLGAHLAPGYVGAVDMLTRSSEDSDFAPDASVFPAAPDPVTGGRQLEELAFEVAASQPLDKAAEKARELVRRGVRRVFCLVVKHQRVLEWSADTDSWSPLPQSACIEDRCFVRPLPVRAITEAATRDDAVIAALDARAHPAIRAIEARGELAGRVASLLAVLEARGLVPTPEQLARIRAADATTLDTWIRRAATAPSVEIALSAPG